MIYMSIKIDKANSTLLVHKAMSMLGIKKTMKTNPSIIARIIKDFKLDDLNTNNKLMQKFFHKAVSKPQGLKPLITCVEKNIISKHPPIIEFLGLATTKKWLKPSSHITTTINAAYILEALTVAMCNDHNFFVEVHNHYKSKEWQRGINTSQPIRTFMHALGLTHNLFGTIKALSVDPAMIYFKMCKGLPGANISKTEAKQLLREKKISRYEYKLLSPARKNSLGHLHELVRLNIYQASIKEYRAGLESNALCAYALNEYIKIRPPKTLFKNKKVLPENIFSPFYEGIAKKENLFPVDKLSQEWVSLYISWNMAFIIGSLDDLDIIFPKLAIPMIIGSSPENFLGARIISLWLTINHAFFRMYEEKRVPGPKNKQEIAAAWGIINKKYALEFIAKETGESPEQLIKKFDKFFSRPLWNWMKLASRI